MITAVTSDGFIEMESKLYKTATSALRLSQKHQGALRKVGSTPGTDRLGNMHTTSNLLCDIWLLLLGLSQQITCFSNLTLPSPFAISIKVLLGPTLPHYLVLQTLVFFSYSRSLLCTCPNNLNLPSLTLSPKPLT